jgi:hypothetical protein
MRRILLTTAAGLLLATLAARASELGATDPRSGQTPPPVPAVKAKAPPADKTDGKTEGATCSQHGTTIDFFDTPREAADHAKKEEKLVFVLHLSGIFEDPRFT